MDMIPAGFRFCPNDKELVHYLVKKISHDQLPCNIIKEVSLYSYDDPKQLIAMNEFTTGKREWYFFTKREMRNGSRPTRTTKNGVWKASRSNKDPILDEGGMVAVKMHLVFYNETPMRKKKTNWLMTEYKVERSYAKSEDDWVLCKVYNNKDSIDNINNLLAAEISRNTMDSSMVQVHERGLEAQTRVGCNPTPPIPNDQLLAPFAQPTHPPLDCLIQHNNQQGLFDMEFNQTFSYGNNVVLPLPLNFEYIDEDDFNKLDLE